MMEELGLCGKENSESVCGFMPRWPLFWPFFSRVCSVSCCSALVIVCRTGRVDFRQVMQATFLCLLGCSSAEVLNIFSVLKAILRGHAVFGRFQLCQRDRFPADPHFLHHRPDPVVKEKEADIPLLNALTDRIFGIVKPKYTPALWGTAALRRSPAAPNARTIRRSPLLRAARPAGAAGGEAAAAVNLH